MVRQALFSILGERVPGARALDLFAGSGALGLEALSRGAASCVFVDEDRGAEAAIRANLAKAKLEGGRVVRAEVAAWLRRERGRYDLVFADPPYAGDALGGDLVAGLLAEGELLRLVGPDGLLVVERAAADEAPAGLGWELLDQRRYGGSAILLYAPGGDL